jgi:hypothetical protein
MRMRIGTVTALSVVTIAAGGTGQDVGRLSGVTQISYGCPGPQRDGEPCERWSSFAGARFRLAKLNSAAAARTITSDRRGRFTLALAVGRYRLTPLRQANTSGGTPFTLTIRTGATTWARVRFEGFPRML